MEEEDEEIPTIDQFSILFWEWVEELFKKRNISHATFARGYDEDTLEINDTLCIVFKTEMGAPDTEDNAFLVWEDNVSDAQFGYFLDYACDELEAEPEGKIKDLIEEKGYAFSVEDTEDLI